jgi:hypothetical protein
MDKKLDTSLTIEFKDQFKMNLLRNLNLEKIYLGIYSFDIYIKVWVSLKIYCLI